MPIEIKELVVRATIDPYSASKKSQPESAAKPEGAAREEIVAECVEQVLEILRRQRER